MTRSQTNNQYSGHSGSPRPKNYECKIGLKFLASIFCDQEDVLHIDNVQKVLSIKAEYYSSLLLQLKDIVKEKRRGNSARLSCSYTTVPRLTRQLQPRRIGPKPSYCVLSTFAVLWIQPGRITPVSWTEKFRAMS